MNVQNYIIDNLNKLNKSNKSKINKKNTIALVGLGPHAKRIYLNYFKKHKVNFVLLIDLESKKDEIREYLNNNGFKNVKIFTISDSLKDKEHLPEEIADNLLAVCNTFEISHLIIATEPKAHNMYLEFALKNNINVLSDKPITVTKNMTSMRSINKVRKQYYDILRLANNSDAMCKIMCQRQYHRGYEKIKEILSDVVEKYQVPITYIDIYHCDGNWEMPHDLLKENHPYKYGYGKLFHSGYHFIDLLSDFIKINNKLTGSKRIMDGEVYSSFLTPNDELNIFNIDDYKRIFDGQNIPDYYENNKKPKFNKFGEKNFYGSIDFKNKYGQLITHANLNLLHYGFSRRGWIESRDYYKNNGRIRHESINIQVGTLMNIQVHSYQSKEIKDRTKDMHLEEQVGGLEHFDIDIYRNVDVIGGKPFERIKLGDLYSDKEKENILGYNELSREVYLTNFLKGKCEKGDIKDQALGIEILYSCAKGLHNYYNNIKELVKIDVRNKYTYPVDIINLKKYSYRDNINQKKDLLNYLTFDKDKYNLGVAMNILSTRNTYEVYCFIEDGKKVTSGLKYKEISNKLLANIYFYYLKLKIKKCNIYNFIKSIEK